MNRCIICGEPGERHHIVYKNQGGFDIPINYIYLCHYHHREENGPHKNRKIDLYYKMNMQNQIMNTLNKNYYNIEEIAKIFSFNPVQAKVLAGQVNKYKLGYKKLDIVKRIMGGKIY
ncbi:HNH endonuclease [Clostridium sp. JNZ J1-5]